MKDKVILTYYNVENKLAEESVWIEKLDDEKYQVKNAPFFAPNIAYNDIITVEKDDDCLYFDEMTEPSEHSTVQIVFFNNEKIKEVIKTIEELGCSWEGINEQQILAVDIPPSVNYASVQKFLERMLSENVFDYKEACLSETHLNNL
ncbi:hypothetical protein CRN76_00480 [Chryseobacterium indologenes]|uniref:DUF4265 domain-containing protein n=1 Tax=Chryseobacterium indologenes TaxID=253 RepID=UPI000BFC3105|nr:DUF4265 domain-containing protein [Chryseobacterium indologenes]ATN04016.1 hypothetical protein CRN76_00480 [Chryseobacterium indologenes]AYY83319.1 DUF4265 domain-containing protein [Chryseobacterium indologenes]QIX80228.1 DUF4265 domain-containing protein [Chryseobacterium indologenes]UDQ53879.1 DUF4265 domain-containing protein [Chryseobacterium indologenes]